jgi:hypothetical protein
MLFTQEADENPNTDTFYHLEAEAFQARNDCKSARDIEIISHNILLEAFSDPRLLLSARTDRGS